LEAEVEARLEARAAESGERRAEGGGRRSEIKTACLTEEGKRVGEVSRGQGGKRGRGGRLSEVAHAVCGAANWVAPP
jgi:hypothetical protein